MRGIALALLAVLVFSVPAAAQSFEDAGRHLKPGTIVRVVDASGHVERGRLGMFTPVSVKLVWPTDVEIPASQIARIDREGDPLWDGAVKGAALGFLPALLSANLRCGHSYYGSPEHCEGCPPNRGACAALGVAMYAVIGVLIDWRHVGIKTVYRSSGSTVRELIVVPLVGADTKSVMLLVRF